MWVLGFVYVCGYCTMAPLDVCVIVYIGVCCCVCVGTGAFFEVYIWVCVSMWVLGSPLRCVFLCVILRSCYYSVCSHYLI